MNTLLFTSDLHLGPQQPELITAYQSFLLEMAAKVDAIYILGDLFEFWIGDDASELLGADPILAVMQQAASITDCYFVAGNRDFLVGEEFEQKTGFAIVADETVIDIDGQPTLILHGDSLCTDDHAHMQFREQMVTNMTWRKTFLQLPIEQRINMAQQARTQSNEHKSQSTSQIMDVNQQSVLDTFTRFQVKQMIHGHTHRQNIHSCQVDGTTLSRYVLGDWNETLSFLLAENGELTIYNRPI